MHIEWIEVDEDRFKGSLLLPLAGHQRGLPYPFKGDDHLPAGERSNTTVSGWNGELKGCQIKANGVTRYFLRSHVEVMTHQQALDRMEANIAKAARETADEFNMREGREADKHGMTVEQYRAWRRDEDMRLRFRRASHRHEDERRAIEGGSWLRGGTMDPNERAEAIKKIPGNRWK